MQSFLLSVGLDTRVSNQTYDFRRLCFSDLISKILQLLLKHISLENLFENTKLPLEFFLMIVRSLHCLDLSIRLVRVANSFLSDWTK